MARLEAFPSYVLQHSKEQKHVEFCDKKNLDYSWHPNPETASLEAANQNKCIILVVRMD